MTRSLRAAGAIGRSIKQDYCVDLFPVLGKANMSELGNFKSPMIPWAYSDIGGQCSSAYVQGGFVKGEGFDGKGNPSGSSSGSAVGLSAGFAAGALGTDARGSMVGRRDPCLQLTGRATLHLELRCSASLRRGVLSPDLELCP